MTEQQKKKFRIGQKVRYSFQVENHPDDGTPVRWSHRHGRGRIEAKAATPDVYYVRTPRGLLKQLFAAELRAEP